MKKQKILGQLESILESLKYESGHIQESRERELAKWLSDIQSRDETIVRITAENKSLMEINEQMKAENTMLKRRFQINMYQHPSDCQYPSYFNAIQYGFNQIDPQKSSLSNFIQNIAHNKSYTQGDVQSDSQGYVQNHPQGYTQNHLQGYNHSGVHIYNKKYIKQAIKRFNQKGSLQYQPRSTRIHPSIHLDGTQNTITHSNSNANSNINTNPNTITNIQITANPNATLNFNSTANLNNNVNLNSSANINNYEQEITSVSEFRTIESEKDIEKRALKSIQQNSVRKGKPHSSNISAFKSVSSARTSKTIVQGHESARWDQYPRANSKKVQTLGSEKGRIINRNQYPSENARKRNFGSNGKPKAASTKCSPYCGRPKKMAENHNRAKHRPNNKFRKDSLHIIF